METLVFIVIQEVALFLIFGYAAFLAQQTKRDKAQRRIILEVKVMRVLFYFALAFFGILGLLSPPDEPGEWIPYGFVVLGIPILCFMLGWYNWVGFDGSFIRHYRFRKLVKEKHVSQIRRRYQSKIFGYTLEFDDGSRLSVNEYYTSYLPFVEEIEANLRAKTANPSPAKTS